MPVKKRSRKTNNAAARVSKLLRRIEERLDKNGDKATVADFVRLLQLEQELSAAEPVREIKVTWVDPEASSEE